LTQASSRQATPSRVVGAGAEAAGDAVPRHVAIIMDGNGRWASERTQPRSEGHRAGVENIRRILRRFVHHGVEYITLFAFSTENWDRPDDEVQVLMELLTEAIERETQPLHEEGVRIKHIGRLDRLSTALQNAIARSVELTKDNDVLTLSVAFNYGGRAEIVDAVRAIAAAGLASSEISEEVFQQYLYTRGLPDVDLIIRTAGEMRLSNFLLWQTHYAEYYSTPVFWPDFDEAEVTKALAAYGRRQRRYGGTASPETS
jgi:undecaprenyl diphosphate synthase